MVCDRAALVWIRVGNARVCAFGRNTYSVVFGPEPPRRLWSSTHNASSRARVWLFVFFTLRCARLGSHGARLASNPRIASCPPCGLASQASDESPRLAAHHRRLQRNSLWHVGHALLPCLQSGHRILEAAHSRQCPRHVRHRNCLDLLHTYFNVTGFLSP